MVKKENLRWRWVYHDLYGLRLFLDVVYSANETCTEEESSFTFELRQLLDCEDGKDKIGRPAPENLLRLLKVLPIPPPPNTESIFRGK